MIVPSQRLLLLAAVVALPLATAARFVPGLEVPCAVALGLCALVAAADAVRGRMRLDGLAVSAPPVVRLTKDAVSYTHLSRSTSRSLWRCFRN